MARNIRHLYILSYNKELKEYSRILSKNMTDAEKLLWSKIRGNQLKCNSFIDRRS